MHTFYIYTLRIGEAEIILDSLTYQQSLLAVLETQQGLHHIIDGAHILDVSK